MRRWQVANQVGCRQALHPQLPHKLIVRQVAAVAAAVWAWVGRERLISMVQKRRWIRDAERAFAKPRGQVMVRRLSLPRRARYKDQTVKSPQHQATSGRCQAMLRC